MNERTGESDRGDGAAHGQPDDTVAQKPPNAQAGTPLTPPANRADLDQANPIHGAQPPLEADSVTMTERSKIAAGLPAICETARFAVGETGASL